MPKRSQEYRDARRGEILGAAKRCFVRDGFHETSMQDLFAESGLSAGAVYRYFASKDEVIVAIAEENLRDVMDLIHPFAADPHRDGLGATIATVLELIRAKNADDQFGAIVLLVWAEVLRNPTLHTWFATALTELRSDLATAVAAQQKSGAISIGVDAEDVATVLIAIVPGVIVQMAVLGESAVAGAGNATRALWPK